MQFTTRNSEAIRAGEVTLTFRSWQRPHAKVGGVYRLRPNGAVTVLDMATVRLSDVSADEAARAGFPSLAELAAFLRLPLNATVTRVAIALTDEGGLKRPPELEADATLARLRRMDERSAEPWTGRVLALIGAHPGRRAGDLAPALGWETPKFKANVRKLKGIGLTQSLEVGYRLTALGEQVTAQGRE